jgi:signal transduction histidine kinase
MKRASPLVAVGQAELEARAARAASLLVFAAVTIYPAWTIFDFLLAPGWWRTFATLRFLQAGVIGLSYLLWRAKRISTDVLVFVAFLGMALEIAFMCAVVPEEALVPYFLGFSTLFVAAGVVILWPPDRSLIVLVAALTALMAANALGEARSAFTLVEHGGLTFVTLAVVSVLVTHMRWEMLRDEIDSHAKIEGARRALEHQAGALASSNRELDRFARAVSHDLKTPMNQLSLAISVLEDSSVDEALRQQTVRDMRRFIQSAARTIDELLAGAHRTAGQPAVGGVDVMEVYRELDSLLGEEIRKAGGCASVDFSQCRKIAIDRGKLKSILLNLLTNAVKFRSPARPLEIRLQTVRAPGSVVLSVSDNGLGIDLKGKDAKTLANSARCHPEIPGSGLGLRFINEAIEAEGGRIEVESEIDRGATFRVWLPEAAAR